MFNGQRQMALVTGSVAEPSVIDWTNLVVAGGMKEAVGVGDVLSGRRGSEFLNEVISEFPRLEAADAILVLRSAPKSTSRRSL